MSLKSAQLDGYLITEREMKPLEKLILDQYRMADKEISKKLRDLYDKMADSSVSPEDQYNWLIQYDRNIKLRHEITQAYTRYDQSAMNLTEQSSRIGMSNNYYRQFYMLEWQDPSLSFAIVPDNLIEYATTGQVEAWKGLTEKYVKRFQNPALWPPSGTLLDIFRRNRADALRRIQATINSGMMAGDSYSKISKKVSAVIGKESGGRVSGQLAKALRIVRTEGNRALNAGSYASSLTAVDQGIEILRMWDATLDGSTRPAHGAADGQTVAYDKPFTVGGEKLMYPGDSAGSPGNIINCRCATVDLVEGSLPEARRGVNPQTGEKKAFSYQSFGEWAKENGLTENKYGMLYKSDK